MQATNHTMADITEDPKVEQLESEDSDDEVPVAQPSAEEALEEEKGSTRGEKKARKAIIKLGMKPVNDVVRVTMKKSKNIMFVVSKPDVFKSPTADSYIIFGEAKIEDLAAKQAQMNAENSQQRAQQNKASFEGQAQKEGAAGEEEAVNEDGIDAKDIALVIDQAHCTRAQAVTALRNNNNDLVNAIMELTI
uniref:NAC-A/B domain-containing protein n=1 Tax=Spumella elongata TaxID=89044 RepID=A0A7S3HP75_9STRA